jgi:hypothetical protein
MEERMTNAENFVLTGFKTTQNEKERQKYFYIQRSLVCEQALLCCIIPLDDSQAPEFY